MSKTLRTVVVIVLTVIVIADLSSATSADRSSVLKIKSSPTDASSKKISAPNETAHQDLLLDYPQGFTFQEVPDPLSGTNPAFPLVSKEIPVIGESFYDLRFGTVLTRVTQTDGINSRHEYSRFDPFNLDQSMIVLNLEGTGFQVYRTGSFPYNQSSNAVITLSDFNEPRWDPVDRFTLWGLRDFKILTVNVQNGQITTIKDFAQDPTIGPIITAEPDLYCITMRGEGESSQEKRFWAFFLQGANQDYRMRYLFTWDRQLDQVLGVYSIPQNESSLDWVGMSWNGNWVLIGGDSYNEGNLTGFTIANKELTQFHRIDFATGHADVGIDIEGNEVIVMQNSRTDYIDLLPLDWNTQPILEQGGSYEGTNHVPLIRLFYDSESAQGLNSGVHISCNVPGYCVVSTYTLEPEAPEQNWLDRTIVLVKLDRNNPRVFYLAKVYNTRGEYWEETQATITNDGSKVVWASNWNQNVGTQQVFLMQLDMPAGWRGSVSGSTYYVSPSGSDDNPGTEALPWKTIGKAAETLSAGDTVYIRAGTYRERVLPQQSGSAGLPIVYASFPGETVTIDGTGVDVPEWSGLFEIQGRSYIRISGLRIINSLSNPHNLGILVENSNHITVEKNYIHNTNDSGIGVWAGNTITVDGNEVEGVCLSLWNENITIGGTGGFEVKNNHVHDSNKEGICTKDGSSNGKVFGNHVHNTKAVGIYVDAQDKHTYNIEVFSNVVHGIQADGFAVASEQGGLLENVKVYNNVSYGNKWVGLNVSDCCIETHPMRNISVINNTFYNNGEEWGGGIALDNPQAEGVVVRNNLCSQNLSFQIAANPTANFTVDHNLIDDYRNGENEIYGADYVTGNPLFVNPGAGDFHLQPSSPAMDNGSSDGAPATDFDNTSRPQGAGFDIGAFEFPSQGQQVVLASGWNLISLPLVPPDPSASVVLKPLAGKLTAAWTFEDGQWKLYDPKASSSLNALESMATCRGYWLRMSEPTVLPVYGETPPDTCRLNTGWNLVGFPRNQAMPPAKALSSLGSALQIVWGYRNGSWRMYRPGDDLFSDLDRMKPGEGYWIKVNGACDWTDSVWHPAPGTSWQLQLTGDIDTSVNVRMYDIDLFNTPQSVIDQLHADGRVVICYFSAGSWEDWRSDADQFPEVVKGKDLIGWPGEKWLDVRRLDVLGPIMQARMDLAVQKGCDGVDPDNVDGYANDTGFTLSAQDQLTYNQWLATEAHARKLSIGLKNDLDQITDLVSHFDWALNEQCFMYEECNSLLPFVQAGKAVFGVEYEGDPSVFCPSANAMEFSWLKKKLDLDAWRVDCHDF